MTGDTKWSAISAIAAVAGLIIPILLLLMGRETKELSVQTVSQSILVDLSNPVLASLKMIYNDVPVNRLEVITFSLTNTGSKPIERADFERPIVIRFDNPSDVLVVSLSEKEPKGLNPLITTDGNGISIAPLLLNPGDRFHLTVQLRGKFTEPRVTARISGVSAITRKTYEAAMGKPIPPTRVLVIASFGTVAYVYYASFVVVGFIRRFRFIVLPKSESLLLLIMLAFTSTTLFAVGIRGLGLREGDIYSWKVFAMLTLLSIMIAYVTTRRARQTYRNHSS